MRVRLLVVSSCLLLLACGGASEGAVTLPVLVEGEELRAVALRATVEYLALEIGGRGLERPGSLEATEAYLRSSQAIRSST